jgi:hypothetical protein
MNKQLLKDIVQQLFAGNKGFLGVKKYRYNL